MVIYFHADDVGANPEITSQVLTCWEQGLIDGFSVIADKNSCKLISQVLNNNSTKKAFISVHLNLSDGQPLSNTNETGLLINSTNKFKISFIKALLQLLMPGFKKKLFLEQVYQEWNKQILLVKETIGEREVYALDGHNHIHMIPSLFKIAVNLAEKHAVKKIRISNEIFNVTRVSDCTKPFFLINNLKRLVLRYLTFIIESRKIPFSNKAEAVLGIQYSGNMKMEDVVSGMKKAKKKNIQSLEIIFHPGKASINEIKKFAASAAAIKFYTSENRTKEYEALKKIKNEFTYRS